MARDRAPASSHRPGHGLVRFGVGILTILLACALADEKAPERTEKIDRVAKDILNPFVSPARLGQEINDAIAVDLPKEGTAQPRPVSAPNQAPRIQRTPPPPPPTSSPKPHASPDATTSRPPVVSEQRTAAKQGQEMGRLKFNPHSEKYYPPDYVFDPFTGAKLQWKDPQY